MGFLAGEATQGELQGEKALLHGTQQSTSTDGSLTVLHRPESRCGKKLGSRRRPSADRTKQEAKTLINLCRVLKMVVS